ncbi:MAG: type VII toxin-antitoxin system HepT family RNase toxin [Desulfurispora sp.]|uniref:type VII toxin-antitoxin system HepT family RNase toxin n=1 Tax=Desulfurispora sp. TaxID=3014275 RepID=UPI00404B0B3D
MSKSTRQIYYVNHELLAQKIADIEKAHALLTKIAALQKERFLEDEIVVSGAKYQLILAIEAAQNICNHLAARLAREAPTSYADCFRILQKQRIVSRGLTEKLVSMARLRNLLLRQYGKVDDAILYNILPSNLTDLLNYVQETKSFLMTINR